MSNLNSKGAVIWSVEKYDIQLELFTNEKATQWALLQWTPSNAREQSEYEEMKEHFAKNTIMYLCANNENEILLDNYNALHFEDSNIVFRENAEFKDEYSHQNLYLYENLEILNGDKYRLYIKSQRNMSSGVLREEVELCILTIAEGRATVQVKDCEYPVKYTER